MTFFSKPVIIMVIFSVGILFAAAALTKGADDSELLRSEDPLGLSSVEPQDCSLSSVEPELRTLFELHQHSRADGTRCGSNLMPSVATLVWSCELAGAAEEHVIDMAKNEFMAHKGSDGMSMGERATKANYIWRNIAENVAMGVTKSDEVYRLWIESSGHCRSIMNPKYTDMGAAEVDGYWVVLFGRP